MRTPSPGTWRRNQFAVTAAAFVGFTGFTLVMPFLPLYIRQLGATDVGEIALWAGLSLGVTPAVTAVLSPFWGRLADRFGRKLMVERSLLSFVVIMAATAYVTRPWHIFALRAIQGLFAGYGGLTLAMAAESAPRDRMASAIGMVQTAQRLGPAIGPIIGGIVAELVGLRQAFFVTAAFYASALVLVAILYRDPERAPEAAHRAAESGSVRALLGLPDLVPAMIAIFGVTFVDRSFGPILPLYVGSLGVASDRVAFVSGALFSVVAAGAVAGNHAAAWLLNRYGPGAIIAGASVGSAATLMAFFATGRISALLLAFAVFGIGLGIATTAAYTAGGRVVPAGAHGTGFGLLTGASLAGLALSPVVSGLLGGESFFAILLLDLATLAGVAVLVRRTMRGRSGPAGTEAPPAPAE